MTQTTDTQESQVRLVKLMREYNVGLGALTLILARHGYEVSDNIFLKVPADVRDFLDRELGKPITSEKN